MYGVGLSFKGLILYGVEIGVAILSCRVFISQAAEATQAASPMNIILFLSYNIRKSEPKLIRFLLIYIRLIIQSLSTLRRNKSRNEEINQTSFVFIACVCVCVCLIVEPE